MKKQKYYIAIDLKSFYASVECIERGLNPLNTNLVVADKTRTEKTICLAVSPSLKYYGISSRARLFEVVQRVKALNTKRLYRCQKFSGKSYFFDELKTNKSLELDYIIAKPRMAHYVAYSNKILDIYSKYIAPEDMHVYSIDEVFIDASPYLKTYKSSPRKLAMTIIKNVLAETGITATAGIGTNLYLAKVAMDILAKRTSEDENGVRIAELDELKYRKLMWSHKPISDFWRIGKGYQKKLQENKMYTMGDIARCSIGANNSYHNQELLYKLFGINAELLIDHAWGCESCEINDIKAYQPKNKSINSGQVLPHPYTANKARLVTWEMADLITLELVDKNLMTNQIVLTISYDIENFKNPYIMAKYKGEIITDAYGRKKPKHSRGTFNFKEYTSSTKNILDGAMLLYDRIINPNLLVRKINISINKIKNANEILQKSSKQLTIFTDYENLDAKNEFLKKENSLQKTIIKVKKKFGKNTILKAANLQKDATTKLRNRQIGGHKA